MTSPRRTIRHAELADIVHDVIAALPDRTGLVGADVVRGDA